MRAEDGGLARVLREHAAHPVEHVVGCLHLDGDVQEAVPAGLEDPRTVGAASVMVHVSGLVAKKVRLGAEGRAEVVEPADVEHAQVLGDSNC